MERRARADVPRGDDPVVEGAAPSPRLDDRAYPLVRRLFLIDRRLDSAAAAVTKLPFGVAEKMGDHGGQTARSCCRSFDGAEFGA